MMAAGTRETKACACFSEHNLNLSSMNRKGSYATVGAIHFEVWQYKLAFYTPENTTLGKAAWQAKTFSIDPKHQKTA